MKYTFSTEFKKAALKKSKGNITLHYAKTSANRENSKKSTRFNLGFVL